MALRTAMREIAEAGGIDFVLTSNQNLIIANVAAKARSRRSRRFWRSTASHIATSSGMRRNSMACVALPTCGLALAESERFLPELITGIEEAARQGRACATTTSSSA